MVCDTHTRVSKVCVDGQFGPGGWEELVDGESCGERGWGVVSGSVCDQKTVA